MFLSPVQIIDKLNLKSRDIVADFGCGSGGYLSAFSKAVGPKGKVYALDINKDLLARLEREAEKYGYDNVEFIVTDVEKKTYLDNYSCDTVCLSNILHQTENPTLVIAEAIRILKPDGFLLIVDWRENNKIKGLGPHVDHLVPEEKVLAILAKHNFYVKKHLPAGQFHYALIAMS